MFIAGASELLGQEFPTYVDMSEYLQRRATSIGIDTEGLIRTEEQIQEEQQMAQQQAMIQQGLPSGITAAGGIAKEAMKNPEAMPQPPQ